MIDKENDDDDAKRPNKRNKSYYHRQYLSSLEIRIKIDYREIKERN